MAASKDEDEHASGNMLHKDSFVGKSEEEEAKLSSRNASMMGHWACSKLLGLPSSNPSPTLHSQKLWWALHLSFPGIMKIKADCVCQ